MTVGILLDAARLAEIDAAGQFADDHHVQTRDHLGAQTRSIRQGRVEHGGTQVTVQTEFRTQAQQAALRTDGTLDLVPLGPADSAEQDGIGSARGGQRRFGQGVAMGVDRTPTHERVLELAGESVALPEGLQYLLGGADDLGPDAVAGKQQDLVRHGVSRVSEKRGARIQ